MGITANQARLMTLTSRMHDLEQRAQQISNTKVISTLKSQTLALEYSNAINKLTEDTFESSDSSSSGGSSGGLGGGMTSIGSNPFPGAPSVPVPAITVNGVAVLNIDAAKSAYDSATFEISKDEKLLDLELSQINTEYNAVTTEYDSVKSLISDNTDKSFSLFG